MEKKKRITGIAELQFVCCCLIVLRHSDPLNGLGIQEIALTNTVELFIYKLINLLTHMTEVAVLTFFFVSGFLYFSNFESMNDYVTKLKKRVGSIVVPFFIWSFLNWLYFAVITHIPVISTKMNMEPVRLDSKSIIRDIAMSKYAPLWFLRVLFCLCVLGIILNCVLNYKRLTLVVISMLMLWNVFAGYGYQSIITWMPYFMGGGYLRKHGSKLVHGKVMLSVATILLIASYVLNEGTTGSVLYIARFLIAAALFSIFTRRETIEKWFWGASMFIYCTHFSIVSAIEKMMFLVLGKNIIIGLVAYIAVPIFVIFTLSYLARFINIKTPNVWRVIVGNRSLELKNEK